MIGRLRRRDEFTDLRRHGVRVRNDPLWCSYRYDPALSEARVAFAIARPVGTAVQRNRLRRRLRALLEACDVPPGRWIIGADRAAVELSFDELRHSLATLVRRAESRATGRRR